MARDILEIKDKIISFIRIHGPSLPVHIAREINQSILFTSAFLSELLSEKRIAISCMRVGNSPIYFIPGQESRLEEFTQYLKDKEKEALMLLKAKNFLPDKEQDPAIMVALRAIKDFAIPFKHNEELHWRYLTAPETEFKPKEEKPGIAPTIIKEIQEIETEIIKDERQEELGIFDQKSTKKKKKPKPAKIKKAHKKILKDDKFFNTVKDFLNSKGIEISGIEGFSKSDLILKIKSNNSEKLLIAYNKKRITESDIIKAHKKSKDYNLEYTILTFGEASKKLKELIESVKGFSGFENIK